LAGDDGTDLIQLTFSQPLSSRSPSSSSVAENNVSSELEIWRNFKRLYKSGVSTFIGLDDHDSAELFKRLENAGPGDLSFDSRPIVFVSPFISHGARTINPRGSSIDVEVITLSPSYYQTAGSTLSKAGEWGPYTEILPILKEGSTFQEKAEDLRDLSESMGFRLVKPVAVKESGDVARDVTEVSVLHLRIFLRSNVLLSFFPFSLFFFSNCHFTYDLNQLFYLFFYLNYFFTLDLNYYFIFELNIFFLYF
jgi:hypothetical protein